MLEDSEHATCPNENITDKGTSGENIVNLELLATGEDASGYRTRNDPSQPYQRAKITERTGVLGAVCKMVDVVHGRLGPLEGHEGDEEAQATLISLDFAFDVRKNARRIEAVQVTFQFMEIDGASEDDPSVVYISPEGALELVETSHTVDTAIGAELNIGAPPLVGLQAGAQLGWQNTTTKEKRDSIRVVGAKSQIGRDYGPDNAASWFLLENSTYKTGVPTSMRALILLKRQNDLPFQCIFTMKLQVDLKSSVERSLRTVFGKKMIDDPILFDPSRKPTRSHLERFNLNCLASESLAVGPRVVARAVLNHTVHQVEQV